MARQRPRQRRRRGRFGRARGFRFRLKPDPATRRQLTADEPMALWRDGSDGREGLVLSIRACGNLNDKLDAVVRPSLTLGLAFGF